MTLSALWTCTFALGIGLGLVAGKSIGVTLLGWLALRSNLGDLPQGVTTHHIVGIGLLGGTGFTMSILYRRSGIRKHTPGTGHGQNRRSGGISYRGLSGYLWMRLRA